MVQAAVEERGSVGPRPFELRVERLRDNVLVLEVWQESMNGSPGRQGKPVRVARVTGAALHTVWEHLMVLLHRNGVKGIALSPSQSDRMVRVGEEVGVRVALLAAAVAPLRKHQRIEAIAAAVTRMSYEEVCYWYAHIRSDDGRRALRALRLLLADE